MVQIAKKQILIIFSENILKQLAIK